MLETALRAMGFEGLNQGQDVVEDQAPVAVVGEVQVSHIIEAEGFRVEHMVVGGRLLRHTLQPTLIEHESLP